MDFLLRFGAGCGILCGVLFALAAPLPDTPLTCGLHVLEGTILVWLSIAVLRTAAARRPRPPAEVTVP